jgi:hypothetical protein
MNACPLRHDWLEYLRADTEDANLTEHVEHCARCQATLDALRNQETPPPRTCRTRLSGESTLPPELLQRLQRLWADPPRGANGHASAPWPEIPGYEIRGVLGRAGWASSTGLTTRGSGGKSPSR